MGLKLRKRPVNLSPVPYVARAQRGYRFGYGAVADQTRALSSMGGVGTLFSIVSKISQSVASTEWCLYKTSTDMRRTYAYDPKPRRQIVSEAQHPALRVWNHPNPHMSRQEFLEITAQHQELVGEQYWAPATDARFAGTALAGVPVELWPLRPDRMTEVPSAENFLDGWEYLTPDGNRVFLTTKQCLQLKAPNPTNIYRGMGAVQSILTNLDVIRFGDRWNRDFFTNGAIPGGVVQLPAEMDDPGYDTFKARFTETHQGVGNAHIPLILENGAEWKDVSYSMKDMQFVELATATDERVRAAFGISKTMIGLTEDVNRASSEAAKAVFAEGLLKARLDRIKGALNNQFLPLFGSLGEGYEFDYISPAPEDLEREIADRASRVTNAKTMIDAGFDPAEVLESFGLPPLTFIGGGIDEPTQPDAEGQGDPPVPAGE